MRNTSSRKTSATGASTIAINTILERKGATPFELLHRADLGAQTEGVISFQWDGALDSGASAVNGTYEVLIEATQGGKKVEASALQLGLVGGITQDKGGVTLNVAGMGKVTLSDVRQVF